VAVTAAGDVVINKRPVNGAGLPAIVAAMQAVVPPDAKDPVVIINADAKAAHQRVIDVMQAAQQAGLVHISFATQAAQR
jgi:biopolymer transport protein ExbD